MNTDIVAYYRQRAAEYEVIYDKPERLDKLPEAIAILKGIFAGKQVFEIACGTGYWTQYIAETATSVLATDINSEVLDIARAKHYTHANVEFEVADFYNIQSSGPHQSLFGGFIWSHIELQQLDLFLSAVLALVEPGGTLVFMDNNFVEGSSLPVDETDEYGNGYQHRRLSDGSLHKVLKNFPTQSFIRHKLEGKAHGIQFIDLKYYWIVEFTKQ